MSGYRRVRVVYFDQSMLVSVLNWMRYPSCQFLQIPNNIDIPIDAEVVSVTPDTIRRAIGVLFFHPTFDEVPEGSMVPEVICWSNPSRVIEFSRLQNAPSGE